MGLSGFCLNYPELPSVPFSLCVNGLRVILLIWSDLKYSDIFTLGYNDGLQF